MLKIGFGTDIHRLEAGDGLRLGGVTIPGGYRAVSYSDGDVLVHAVIDALLGACALGDIGDHFPESKVRKGEDSVNLLAETLDMFTAAGGCVVNVDCVVDLEAVRLGEWKSVIAAHLASLLGLPRNMVSVKAKTAEGLGSVGRREAVSAQAVVLVELTEGNTHGA